MNTVNKYIRCMFASGFMALHAPVYALTQLDDVELSSVTGQSFFNLTYVAPSQSGNPHTNIGFYRVGLEAELELNANIRRLALGCGGINGAVGCDIDASNVRFSGFAVANDPNRTPIANGGPTTDALIRNPFFEVAVLNPNTASTREIAGLRLGFSEFFGMLSVGEFIGTEGNTASQNTPANHTGVGGFSANISAINLDNITIPVVVCSGGVNAGRTGCGALSTPVANATSVIRRDTPTAGAPGDNEFVNNILTRNNSTVTTRGNSTQTFASMQNFGGVDYQRLQLHNVRVRVTNVSGVTLGNINFDLNVTFNEALNFLHQLPIGADNDGNGNFSAGDTTVPNVYFSLSKLGDVDVANTANWLSWQNIAAPTQWKRASRGWSLGVDEFNLGNFTTSTVYVSSAEALGGTINNIPITNVDLLQRPVDNCYGALTFC